MQTTKSQEILKSFFLAATIEGKSKRTLELYDETLKPFAEFIKPKSLLEATSNDIRSFVFDLQKKNRARATIYTHLKELRVFYNYVFTDRKEENPMANIKAPKLPKSYPYVLSEDEVDRLLKAIKGRDFEAKRNYAIILFFLDTGVRVSELVGLNLDDVSLATYTAKVSGKTGERTVHFGQITAKALASYLKKRGFLAHEDAFFVSVVSGGNRLTRSGVQQIIRKLGQKAGVDKKKRVSPHTLRHTCATFWIKNGGDPVSLQRQLGQSDPRMVDVYVNLVGKDLKEDHNKYSPLKRLI